jgi:hypothetical protein
MPNSWPNVDGCLLVTCYITCVTKLAACVAACLCRLDCVWCCMRENDNRLPQQIHDVLLQKSVMWHACVEA